MQRCHLFLAMGSWCCARGGVLSSCVYVDGIKSHRGQTKQLETERKTNKKSEKKQKNKKKIDTHPPPPPPLLLLVADASGRLVHPWYSTMHVRGEDAVEIGRRRDTWTATLQSRTVGLLYPPLPSTALALTHTHSLPLSLWAIL